MVFLLKIFEKKTNNFMNYYKVTEWSRQWYFLFLWCLVFVRLVLFNGFNWHFINCNKLIINTEFNSFPVIFHQLYLILLKIAGLQYSILCISYYCIDAICFNLSIMIYMMCFKARKHFQNSVSFFRFAWTSYCE